MNRKRVILKIAGALLGIVLIGILIYKTDVDSIIKQLGMMGSFFPFVILVTFVSQFIAVFAWYLSFSPSISLSALFHLFNIRLIGESFAQVNPTNVIAGETLKGILLKDMLGVDYLQGAASLLLSRIMIILSSGALLVVGAAFLFQRLAFDGLKTASVIVCILILTAILGFIYALKAKKGIFAFAALVIKKLFGRFEKMRVVAEGISRLDLELIEFYHQKKSGFYLVFFLSVLHRIVGSMEYYVIFWALDINAGFVSCILFDLSSMLFRSAGFFVPAQLGFEEFGNKLMCSLTNIPGEETWVTVSLVRRGRQIFWILAGFVVYMFLSSGIKKELKRVNV
ncbi:MAG: flippase-like domain-containing protein [Leptospirales bacterium]|nr:flippase-like domain-containing protein [Leptospirales bacterium]